MSLGCPKGIAARETAQALKTLASAARGVAASTENSPAQSSMLDTARDVMDGSALLIQEAKHTLASPGDAESQQRLAQVIYLQPQFSLSQDGRIVLRTAHDIISSGQSK
eukprot:g26884.t1